MAPGRSPERGLSSLFFHLCLTYSWCAKFGKPLGMAPRNSWISAPLCGQDGPHRGHKRNRREQYEGPARWILLRFGLLSPLPRTEYFGFPGLWRNKPGPDYTFCPIQNKLQTEQTCCLQSLGIFVKNFRNNNGVLHIRLGPDNFSPAFVLDWSPSWANFFSNFLLDAFAMFLVLNLPVSCRTGQGWRSLSQISEHFRLPRASTQTGFWFWSKSWLLQTKPGPDNFWPDLCWIEVLLWLFFCQFFCVIVHSPTATAALIYQNKKALQKCQVPT